MAVEFKEYKAKRKPLNTRHKFPLLRLLFLAGAAVAVYLTGVPIKIANSLPLLGGEPAVVVDTWESLCTKAGGIPLGISDSVAQCSWKITEENQDSLLLPNPFLRYLASLRTRSAAEIVWIFRTRDFSDPLSALFLNEKRSYFHHLKKQDSSYVWIRGAVAETIPGSLELTNFPGGEDGCRFPGVCPRIPLEWSAIPITDGFDFEGQESLIAADVFRGLGEAPIQAVLPGCVVDLGKDSQGYFMEIAHGNNISSRTFGMGMVNEIFSVGDTVPLGYPIGRLAPRDSSVFYLSVRENGRFIRWKEFYGDAYPVSEKEISDFRENLVRLLDSGEGSVLTE